MREKANDERDREKGRNKQCRIMTFQLRTPTTVSMKILKQLRVVGDVCQFVEVSSSANIYMVVVGSSWSIANEPTKT